MIIIFFLIFLSIFTLYFLFMLNMILMRGHDLPSSGLAIKKVLEILKRKIEGKKNFYDLGCGRGKVVVAIKKNFPHLLVYGIDKMPLQIFFAKLKNLFFRQNIIFQKEDLFKTNLKNADFIYTYLWYDLMPALQQKLQKELNKGSIVITNTSNFPNWKPKEIHIVHPKKPDFEKLFVYIK